MKLLVVDLHHLGDAVMALPFLKGAAKEHEVHVCCRPSVRPVFNRVLLPDRIQTWEPPWHEESPSSHAFQSLQDAWKQIRRWRAEQFDAAVCVWADSRVHAMFAMAGIPTRIGFPMNTRNYYAAEVDWRARKLKRGKQFATLASLITLRPLLTSALERLSPRQHHMESWKQIATHLGFQPDTSTPWFGKTRTESAFTHILHLNNNRRLLVHTGGRLATKRWPLDRFQELLDDCLADYPGWSVFIVSGPGEPCPVSHAANQCVLHPGSVDELIDLAGTMDLTLCNDSLAGHLAAAWGKKSLVIFGSGQPDWFAPGANRETVIGPAPCPYHPCIDVCRQPDIICLKNISVQTVKERLESALNQFAPLS